ncbi:ABC-type dipeptide/oligopeptide/nickel transport system permease component [Anaerosolibacter carboniphilus]|uniref:ABC-type dipeptide/oligopeptide/nickel transport system permease component n=1 Tax=Anaerosolibacter carboniphilus TaxID=1417629 RepID=A0A841KUT9_9FIRM|nr:M28 family peptidase [Anaerosolibacter carboniphilus]MBB6215780.1 ABC-type dipeptide/oligopeptide/nickel transport system permease component [Anaerosolibacter carboniphilus]
MKKRFEKIGRGNKIVYMIWCLLIGLIGSILLYGWQRDFDETSFDVNRVYDHIKELSSPQYNGRLPGTEGNQLALTYIENYFKEIGVEPGGEGDGYYQDFEHMVASYNEKPYFRIIDSNGNLLQEYNIREHYRDSFEGRGDIEGDLLYIPMHIRNYSEEEIKGKILLVDIAVDEEYIDYAKNHGAKAIVATIYDRDWRLDPRRRIEPIRMMKGSGNLYRLEDPGIILHYVEIPTFVDLKRYAENKYRAEIGYYYAFQNIRISNILGKVQGKNPDAGYVIISAHIDHVGADYDGRYFPGALDDASGTAMMMEIARVIKAQKSPPEKTMIFAGWNNEEGGIAGSRYYTNHPIYSLEKTQMIQLDCIGSVTMQEIDFASAGEKGVILQNKFKQLADLREIKAIESNFLSSDHAPFIEKRVPAVLIEDNFQNIVQRHHIHTYKDDINNISKENLSKVAVILLDYIKGEVYGDFLPDYLETIEWIFLGGLALFGIIIYIIYYLSKTNPAGAIGNLRIEDIYYATPFRLLAKCYHYISLMTIVVFILVFVANIPTNFNLMIDQGNVYTNLSIPLTVKKSVLYMRGLFANGFGKSAGKVDIMEIVLNSFGKSMMLILSTLILSTIIGVVKGILDGYRDTKNGMLRTMGTLAALSIPDVLIVIAIQIMVAYMYKHNILTPLMTKELMRKFILPMICLSVVPSVYISRITTVVLHEEMKKSYVKAARAKGLSRYKVLVQHLLIGVIMKVIDSLSSVIPIIISNLIIVEYFFHYPGVIYMLLKVYQENDQATFLGLSLSLGLMYVVFNIGFTVLSFIVNPLKREGIQ